ncbi:MAG: hypothetical protein C4521_12255 [Actinobacteria bacterium]|nr:MAG: hypothetical protein C4521_12255 [Actinomycetota bacterium]
MARHIRTALIIALVPILSLSVLSCGRNEVSVKAGRRIICKYGHVIKDTSRFIKVDPSKAKNYSVSQETTICARHLQAQRLYAEAQAALAKRAKARAKALLAKVVALDPEFEQAASQYESLGGSAPKVVGSSGGGSSGAAASNSKGGTAPKGSTSTTYLGRLPRSVPSYKLISQSEDVLSGTRLFAATQSSNPVRLLTFSASWLGTKTDFKSWYDRTLKARYSVGASSVKEISPYARFGTDGSKYANVTWPHPREKGLVFSVEMEARKGNPLSLKTTLISTARKYL